MQVQGECEKTPHRKVPAGRWIQTQDHEASLLTTALLHAPLKKLKFKRKEKKTRKKDVQALKVKEK